MQKLTSHGVAALRISRRVRVFSHRNGMHPLSILLLSAALAGAATCPLGGSGTSGDPYVVATYGQLDSLGANCALTDTFVLANDIDASVSDTENSGRGFTPIGNGATPFSGVFHGAGHTITHLHISDSTDNDVGLFGAIDSASIDSLGLDGSNISGWATSDSGSVGGIAGISVAAGILHCHVANDTVTGLVDSASVGGLVGINRGTIAGCQASASVSGGLFVFAGGIAGSNSGRIGASHASGRISGQDSSSIGGVAGYSAGVLSQDTSTATVSGTGTWASIGGVVGWSGVAGIVDTCNAADTVSGNGDHAEIGGLVGHLDNSLLVGRANSVVSGTGPNALVGGLVGVVSAPGTVSSSWAVGSVAAPGNGASLGGVAGQCTGTGANVDSSWASGDVTGGNNANAGGVVGWNDIGGTVVASYATGSVFGGTECDAGGVVGWNNGVIDRDYSSGRISGYGNRAAVGGVVGWNYQGPVSRSYSTGHVSGNALPSDSVWVGGVAGYSNDTLREVYSAGPVDSGTGANVYVAGIAGQSTAVVYDAFWNAQTSGRSVGLGRGSVLSSPGAPDTAIGLGTAQMRDSANFTGFLFGTDTGWKISQNRSYPALNGVVNAPFAFADSLFTTTTFALGQLLTNDIDVEAGSPPLVAILDTLYGDSLATFNGAGPGTKDSLLYRVGAVASPGDTIWGGTAQAKVERVSFSFALAGDSLKTYGDAPFAGPATVDPPSLPVTYTSQDTSVVQVSGSTWTVRKVGTTTITATLGNLTGSGSLRVAPKTLNATGARNKVYDGTVAATVADDALSGVVPGDTVKLTVTSATFDTKDTGTAKTVTVTGATLSGSGAGNYVLAAVTSLTANITPKTLMIAAKADTIPVNGTASLAYTDTGLVSPDAITGALQSSNSGTATPGTYAITLGSLSAGSNYAVAFTGADLFIRQSTALAATPVSRFAPSHTLATNIGQAFAPPAIGSGRAELGSGAVSSGENAQTVDILLTGPGSVSVAIYDNLGSLVISFTRDIAWLDLNGLEATADGRWILPLAWNLRAQNGIAVPTGVYLWKIDVQTLDGQKLDEVKKLGVRAAR